MKIENWASSEPLPALFREMRTLELDPHIAELDAFGFTVVPPEKVAPPEFQQRILDAILAVHERRSGQRIDDLGNAEIKHKGALYHGMIFDDPIFEEMLMNPVVRALAHYLCGRSAVLSDFAGFLRSQGSQTLALHSDTAGAPPPLPEYAQVCNVTWIHTDYSRENGALSIVPGSHRLCRQPAPYESDGYGDDALVKPIAIEAKAGSIVCWHGNTWHGAWDRQVPGVRVNTIIYFCRSYMRPLVDFAARASEDALARHPPEFAELLGCRHPWPLTEQGKPRGGSGNWGLDVRNPWG